MNSLNPTQIEKIRDDVRKARITLEVLSQELTDHICCEVENLMSTGLSFEEAYAEVQKQTGIRVLKEIEEKTLYLTDKKYATMKTTMKITGTSSLIIIAAGTLLKIFHRPGAGVLLFLGFVLLCLVFFPSLLYLDHRYKKGQSAWNNIFLFLGGVPLMAGVLFKVQHWPMSSVLLLCGWAILIFIYLPVLISAKLRETKDVGPGVYITGGIGLALFSAAALFKMFHWPGAAVLMLTGSIILVGIFLPNYSAKLYKHKPGSEGEYIYLITLCMFAVLLTFLLSMNVSVPVLKNFSNDTRDNQLKQEYLKSRTETVSNAKINNTNELIQKINELKSLLAGCGTDMNPEQTENLIKDPESIPNQDQNAKQCLEKNDPLPLINLIKDYNLHTPTPFQLPENLNETVISGNTVAGAISMLSHYETAIYLYQANHSTPPTSGIDSL